MSSRNRRKRADEMRPPLTERDLFELAFDTENQKYPIYREIVSNKIGCVATGNKFSDLLAFVFIDYIQWRCVHYRVDGTTFGLSGAISEYRG